MPRPWLLLSLLLAPLPWGGVARAAVDCGSLPAADVTICEDLASGSSAEVHGGTFTGSGFGVSDWGSWLHWDLPVAVDSGYAEWTVEGIGYDTWAGDNVIMLQLYDTGGHWGSTYGLEFRGYGPEGDVTYVGKLKLKAWSPGGHDEVLISDPGWDGSPHRFRVEFGDVGRLFRDGALLAEFGMAGWGWSAWNLDLPSQEWTGLGAGGYSGPMGVEVRDLVFVGWDGEGGGGDDDVADDDATGDGWVELGVVDDVTTAVFSPGTVSPEVEDLAASTDGVGSLEEVAYLKFDATSVPGTVTRATLRIHARSIGSAEGDGATVYAVADDSWSEETLVWNQRPPTSGGALGSTGHTEPSVDYEVDVTAAVQAGQLVSLALTGGANGSHFSSKEDAGGAFAPRLRVEYDETAPGDDDTAPGDDDTSGGDDDDVPGDDDAAGGDDDAAGEGVGPESEEWDSMGCGCGAVGGNGAPEAAILALAPLAVRRARRGRAGR
ncbi:DNRLRE domain-containing protein [Myxococcota bacterium]|nr:DNRLRE domain-containing protein [Myxococcota bacterium]